MGMNSNIFDFIKIGVIASGGDPNGKGDHPSDESSNQKVILPGEHDPNNVKQEHLAFSPMIHSPSSMSQQTFQGVMDPGSLVYFLKMPGQTQGLILGQANDLVNYDKGGSGGGKNLLQAQYFQDLMDRETGVNIPPDIEDAQVDGAKVKRVKEKGKKHKHSLLKGTPSHGSMFQTTGYKLPEVKDVPTAKQQYSQIMTNDMMNMLPGDLMSLGGMFQGLMGNFGSFRGGGGGAGGGAGAGAGAGAAPGGTTTTIDATGQQTTLETSLEFNRMDNIMSNVSPEIYDAITSIGTLSQCYSSNSAASGYCSGFRVDTETFLNNAEQLLSQVTSLSDLMDVLNTLQHDESLHGLENLVNTVIITPTAWGNANTIITGTGEIITQHANTAAENSMTNNMSSPASNPGSGGGQNMFGNKVQNLMDMMKRLPPNAEQQMKKVMDGMNNEQDLLQIVKSTVQGGNPLSNFMG